MSSTPSPRRDHGLDNLRVFVIILVVLLHASLSYMAFAPQWWYVLDPKRSLFFTGLVLAIDVPIMLIMFFLAGYFAYPSLAKRGPAAFLRDKFVRIGIPWIFGTLALAPPTAYLIFYTRKIPVTLGHFWSHEFWSRLCYQQSVYWYLGVLLGFFALTAAIHAMNRRFAGWRDTEVLPSRWLFPGFLLLMTAASLALTRTMGFDTWTHNYLFVYQPVRVPLYIGYFALGIVANRQRWFTAAGYNPSKGLWIALCAVSCVVYLGWRLGVPPAAPTLASRAITAVLFNLFCFCSLLGSVALFQAHVSEASPLWASQARNSYGVYYLHPLVLYPLALALVPFPISIYLKAATITLMAYLVSWALSAGVLTRAPGLRRMF
jgi:hypothetical protein